MVYSVLLVTSLYFINVLYELSPILQLLILFKIMNLLIHNFPCNWSICLKHSSKRMSIRSDNQRTSIPADLFDGVCFNILKSNNLYLKT